MRRMTRRELVSGLIMSGLTSCVRSKTRQPKDSSTITVLYGDGQDETTWFMEDMPMKFLVFTPLVVWNNHGELEGRLAESWAHSLDFRAWYPTTRRCPLARRRARSGA